MARRRPEPPEECSQCGASIPRDALACPDCGADERTGWDTNPYLPETDHDIPDYLIDDRDERHDPPIFDHQTWASRGWWLVAVVVVIFLLWTLTRR